MVLGGDKDSLENLFKLNGKERAGGLAADYGTELSGAAMEVFEHVCEHLG